MRRLNSEPLEYPVETLIAILKIAVNFLLRATVHLEDGDAVTQDVPVQTAQARRVERISMIVIQTREKIRDDSGLARTPALAQFD